MPDARLLFEDRFNIDGLHFEFLIFAFVLWCQSVRTKKGEISEF